MFKALLANPAARKLMRQLLVSAGLSFDEAAFEQQVQDANYFNVAIAPLLRKMPPQKLAVLMNLQDPQALQELVQSVNALAADESALAAVTQDLSSDVKNTVEKIRE